MSENPSPQSALCNFFSDHRRRMDHLLAELSAARADLDSRQFEDLMAQRLEKLKVLKKSQEEKELRWKEKTEEMANKCTNIKVAQVEDMRRQIGHHIYFDLVDFDEIWGYWRPNETPFLFLKNEIAKKFRILVQFQRYWFWGKRQNGTYRPKWPLTAHEEQQTVGYLKEVSKKFHNVGLNLFLEKLGPVLSPHPLPDKSRDVVLIFFKLYDAKKEELRNEGPMLVKAIRKPLEILAELNERAGFPKNEKIDLFEEIRFEPNVKCKLIDKRISFKDSKIGDGAIICFQKAIISESETNCRYPDVPSFLDYVHNRKAVHFRPLKNPKKDEFSLELSKLHTYDDVVERVACRIGLNDPSKICLTAHDCYYGEPWSWPLQYRGAEHLSDMLLNFYQNSDILYYEVLDIPLPELQGLKTLNIIFHHSTKDEVVSYRITLPKNSTVGDVTNYLKSKVRLSRQNSELRMLEVLYHRIFQIFPPPLMIENIYSKHWTEYKSDQYKTLRAEEIPEEEANLGPLDRLIHVYHFMRDPIQKEVQNFGEPFLFVIHEGETLAKVKKRIQKKLEVEDKEFAKWKFAFIYLNCPEYLKDSDVISTCFKGLDYHRTQKRDVVYVGGDQYLGLEHTDTTPKKSIDANQVFFRIAHLRKGDKDPQLVFEELVSS